MLNKKRKSSQFHFWGGTLEKTKLLNKEDANSLVYRELASRQYPKEVRSSDYIIRVLNDFLTAIQECSGELWPSRRYSTSLIKSSYGLSIFIELFPHIKKEFEYRNLSLTKSNFKNVFQKLKGFLTEKDSEGRDLWEKSTLTSAGTRRKALKHFIRKYLLTIPDWKNASHFKNIVSK